MNTENKRQLASRASASKDPPGWFTCGTISFTDPMGRRLLRGVTLQIDPPCLCVITGPSGSGKTSLLRAIVGLNKANVLERRLGDVIYPDKRLSEWRSKVTLLLQDAPCIPGTIEENLSFPFAFKNSGSHRFSRDEAIKLMEWVGLGHFGLSHSVDGFSGGERHRLSLVRGLVWAPPVLLADEPLAGLEPELAQKCFDLLLDFSRQRPAVVICVLHEERFAKQADLLFRLKDGTLHRT